MSGRVLPKDPSYQPAFIGTNSIWVVSLRYTSLENCLSERRLVSKPFFEIVFERFSASVFNLFFPFFCSRYLLASLRLKAYLKRGVLRRFLGALCFHLLSVQNVCIWLSSFSSFSASVSCTPVRPNACTGTPFSALFIAGLGSLSEKRNLKGSRGQERLCDIMVLAHNT